MPSQSVSGFNFQWNGHFHRVLKIVISVKSLQRARSATWQTWALRCMLLCCLQGLAQAASLNPDVTPDTVQQTICVKGYTDTVRPSTHYTNTIKFRLMQQASIPQQDTSEWALDHKVALVLGGHPRALDNLQLLTTKENGRKARVEVKLQCLVCSGQVSLMEAQTDMESNWVQSYHRYAKMKCVRHKPHLVSRSP